jgi:hypothetical protein
MTEVITHTLYGGEVVIDFLPNSHAYRLHGSKDRLISVTSALSTIAKPALIPWAVRMATDFLQEQLDAGHDITPELLLEAKRKHQEKKETAATLGSEVHKWVEAYIKNNETTLPTDERILNGVLAFLKWREAHGVQFVSSERLVYSKKYGFVGTLDAEAIIDGKRCVIDFKTSNGIWAEMRFQTAAYQKAAEEEGTIYDGDRIIARFDKETGDFEAHSYGELEEDFEAFLASLTLKNREKTLAKESL